MTKKTNKGKKPLQKMTVSQFKVWIQGLTAFQDDNWVPNIHQWNLVKEMIENLDDSVVVQHTTSTPSAQSNRLFDEVVLPNQNPVVMSSEGSVPSQNGGVTAAVPSQPVHRFPLAQQFNNGGKQAQYDDTGKPIGESNPPPAFI